MAGYVLIYKRNGTRVRDKKGNLIQWFQYANEAWNYINRKLNNSPYVTILKV